MTIGIYAGSFDPITHGHLSIIHQAEKAFTTVIVAVGVNTAKRGLFSTEERAHLIRESLPKSIQMDSDRSVMLARTNIDTFEGLLVSYCEFIAERWEEKVTIVRGLRAVSDFESEMGIASLNSKVNENIPTAFFPTAPEHAFVSSSHAKEMALFEDAHTALRTYVPEHVAQALILKMKGMTYAGQGVSTK